MRLTAQPPVYARTPLSSKPLAAVRVAALGPGATAAQQNAAPAAATDADAASDEELPPTEDGVAAFAPAAITEGESPQWPDDAAESAFRAEAKDRGETIKAARSTIEAVEDATDAKALPKLEDMVAKIPAEVRDVLEDLFRAKFVRVQKIPKRLLKST